MRDLGVQRIVYTDIARDGTLTGVNVEATAALARGSGLKVIASGGVASLADIRALAACEDRRCRRRDRGTGALHGRDRRCARRWLQVAGSEADQVLAKRIIPCLDVKNGRVVKGVNFLELRDAGDPVEQAQVYDREGADELVFLDITASHERRDIVIDMVRRVADAVFIPFTVGGGIRTVDDMRALLLAGADKVSINSPAVRTPDLVTAGATRFGSQCVVVAIDGKWQGDRWEVFIDGGRTPTGLDVVEWSRRVEKLGAGEILLTSMDTDGTRRGYRPADAASGERSRNDPGDRVRRRRRAGALLRRADDWRRGRGAGRVAVPLPDAFRGTGQSVPGRARRAGAAGARRHGG